MECEARKPHQQRRKETREDYTISNHGDIYIDIGSSANIDVNEHRKSRFTFESFLLYLYMICIVAFLVIIKSL